MKTYTLALLCILLTPAINAAVSLALGTLALPLLGLEPVGGVAFYALMFLIADITGYLAMDLLRQELFPEIGVKALRHGWFHGWGKDAGPIRTIGKGMRMGLITVAVGCSSLMAREGYPSISEEAWPFVLLGAAIIAILAYTFLFAGWYRGSQEMGN